jgi:hypothetical protein
VNSSRKNRSQIIHEVKRHRYEIELRRRKIKEKKRIQYQEPRKGLPIPRKARRSKSNNLIFNIDLNSFRRKKQNYIDKYLPPNLDYLVKYEESPFFLGKIKKEKYNTGGKIELPPNFSIIDEPEVSYLAIKKVISALLVEDNQFLVLDYDRCEKVELSSQVLLDIILKDFHRFTTTCHKIDRGQKYYFPSSISGININNEGVRKMMFSVGSPVTLKVTEINYPDIIPYKLCIHDNEKEKNYNKRIEQKEIDTTEMADYVIDCLQRMNKKLTPEKRDDLCTVIGEVLINAEEHSTTKYRFSIGYFREVKFVDEHYGIFRLVILNFGQTIYNKFKDENCPNKEIVSKMEDLSKSYTSRNLFFQKKFEEETLWTLYALQEEVTSTSPTEFKRGNGSIRFIDSFFNIKGSKDVDDISYMKIQSGKTRIHFNGEYSIESKTNTNNDTFKVMTFNTTANIEDIPDNKFVYQTVEHFPGTIISAKLLLNDDDIIQIKKNNHEN